MDKAAALWCGGFRWHCRAGVLILVYLCLGCSGDSATQGELSPPDSGLQVDNQQSNGTEADDDSGEGVLPPPEPLMVTAWVGREDTVIRLPDEALGLTLYEGGAPGCEPGSEPDCGHTHLGTIEHPEIVTNAITLTASASYALAAEGATAMADISAQNPGAENGARLVSFRDRMWVLGGFSQDRIWSSADGDNWMPHSNDNGFSPRSDHAVVFFQGRLWLVAGYVGAVETSNEVYSSADGLNWTLEATPSFPARARPALTVHNDQLWLIGGENQQGILNDVWSSADGVNWQSHEVPKSAEPLRSPSAASFNEHLLVVGSTMEGNGARFRSSPDGSQWSADALIPGVTFPVIYGGRTLLDYAGQLWLFNAGSRLSTPENASGDEDYTPLLASGDGINWHPRGQGASVPANTPLIGAAAHRDKLWTMTSGGRVRSSADGSTWSHGNHSPDFGNRNGYQVTAFRGRLWLIGGMDRATGENRNDIWSSRNGVTWILESSDAGFAERRGHQALVYDDRLWVIGGKNGEQSLDDVWYSGDGIEWQRATDSAGFLSSGEYRVAVVGNQLWAVGGRRRGSLSEIGYTADVWSSGDGVNWTLVTDQAPFPESIEHDLAVVNDTLHVIGRWEVPGINFTGMHTFDYGIWSHQGNNEWVREAETIGHRGGESNVVFFQGRYWQYSAQVLRWGPGHFIATSEDGVVWSEPEEEFGFEASVRANPNLTVHDDHLILTFLDRKLALQVWRTADGVNWRRGIKTEFRFH